jgi:protein-S-isoprenylcysteine O-methyltransferase Ste14
MRVDENKKLTFWGASPIVFIITILYAIPIIIVNHLFKPVFEITFIPYKILTAAAIFLLCIGVPLYVLTLKALKTAHKKKVLITTGVFSVCRNPLFAQVIFLILPGIILFFNSWLLLTIPCFVYVMFKIFINREELLMEREFGQKYVEYKNNTSAIFPRIWDFKK